MSDTVTRANALDHVVVVLFENRSLDNVLGHLYASIGPGIIANARAIGATNLPPELDREVAG